MRHTKDITEIPYVQYVSMRTSFQMKYVCNKHGLTYSKAYSVSHVQYTNISDSKYFWQQVQTLYPLQGTY